MANRCAANKRRLYLTLVFRLGVPHVAPVLPEEGLRVARVPPALARERDALAYARQFAIVRLLTTRLR